MFESKYSKVLTVILVIVIIAIIGLLGFLGYEYYQKYVITKDTSDFVDNFQGEVSNGEPNDTDNIGSNDTQEDPFANIQDPNTGNNSSNKVKTYQGYVVAGTIEIPATGIKYPVLDRITTRSLEIATVFLYGTGLNQPGNSVIVGHNYRNGLFFSNNKKLNKGDKIYITDNSGKRIAYTIYKKFEANEYDTSFYQRDTNGKAEITLSTCTENVKTRLIILASAD